jgi:hypothetical protein
MKEMKLKLHSVVALITNSSTVLYTDSSKSVDALKDVMVELFKLHNIDKEVSEVFDISLKIDDLDNYIYEHIMNNYGEFGLVADDDLSERVNGLTNNFMEEIKLGKDTENWTGTAMEEKSTSSYISIVAKDERYEYLSVLLKKLIYSVDVEESDEW